MVTQTAPNLDYFDKSLMMSISDLISLSDQAGIAKMEHRRREHRLAVARGRNQATSVRREDQDDGFEKGVVRMKIVVRKQDVKQVLHQLLTVNQRPVFAKSPAMALEQRLNLMRRRHLFRNNGGKVNGMAPWRPALNSIPEEL